MVIFKSSCTLRRMCIQLSVVRKKRRDNWNPRLANKREKSLQVEVWVSRKPASEKWEFKNKKLKQLNLLDDISEQVWKRNIKIQFNERYFLRNCEFIYSEYQFVLFFCLTFSVFINLNEYVFGSFMPFMLEYCKNDTCKMTNLCTKTVIICINNTLKYSK